MNRASIDTSVFSNTQFASNERLAGIHESAKQRAQALRRDAISGLIDDLIAWVVRKPAATHQASTAKHSHSACAA
ncbi:MAG: hypothetical protein ACRDAM_06695 [Casimicrobium sp.]